MLTPDLIPPDIHQDDRRLGRLCRPALDLEQSEISRLCLDRFLALYSGHPHNQRILPEVVREGVNYEQKWLGSYSREGHLICVRYSSQTGLKSDQRQFVASANLASGQIKEWRVREARYRYRPEGGGPVQTDLVLGDDEDSQILPPYPVLSGYDAIVDEVRLRDYQQQLIDIDARAARVIMTSQGCWFKPVDGQLESLAPVSELVADLEVRLPQLLGQRAIEATQNPAADHTEPVATL